MCERIIFGLIKVGARGSAIWLLHVCTLVLGKEASAKTKFAPHVILSAVRGSIRLVRLANIPRSIRMDSSQWCNAKQPPADHQTVADLNRPTHPDASPPVDRRVINAQGRTRHIIDETSLAPDASPRSPPSFPSNTDCGAVPALLPLAAHRPSVATAAAPPLAGDAPLGLDWWWTERINDWMQKCLVKLESFSLD
jgi:hypothetical protein